MCAWFQWSTDIGPVIFYAAVIAANDNGNELGDTIYLKSQTLTYDANPPGISEHALLNFSIYPNPATSNINISLDAHSPAGNYTIRFYNIYGSFQTVIGKQETRIDLSQFQNGMYFYTIMEDGLPLAAGKIMIIK